MGCRNKVNIGLLFICCLCSFCFHSCHKNQDSADMQTVTWILHEFGEKTTIQSISPIPVTHEHDRYWRVSLLLDSSKRWEGLVWFSMNEKKYEKIEIIVPPTEGQ